MLEVREIWNNTMRDYMEFTMFCWSLKVVCI